MNLLSFTDVKITDAYWLEKITLVRGIVLPYQWEILNDRVQGAQKSYCIRNFRAAAGEIQAPHSGVVFLDSDLYKWLEAASYSLAIGPDSRMETWADEAVGLIAAAQQQDGYLNTYYTLMKPDKRYTNLMEGHELYCAGHMIEAAVAYSQATGKDKLLGVALKLARHLYDTFMHQSKYPGHPEIELALYKLYEHTGERFCLDLSKRFIDVRGQGENQMEKERLDPGHEWIWEDMKRFDSAYFQTHLPLRKQESAQGHAVRAMYMYSAMADAAKATDDEQLKEACKKLFQSVRGRRMYVTGGIGSSSFGERFTSDWDLPNDTMYCETCASVGLMLFTRRMAMLTGDVSAYNVWERALRNTVLAGLGGDGKHFFYVNPLQVIPAVNHGNMTMEHIKTVRQSWFGVACCPPNIARTLLSLSGSIYAQNGRDLYVLAHIESEISRDDLGIRLTLESGGYRLYVRGEAMNLRLRIPEGCIMSGEGATERDGELIFRHPGGQAVYSYSLIPRVRLVYTDPRVSYNNGKACLMRGLDVYCLEEADNGPCLSAVYLPDNAVLLEDEGDIREGLPVIRAEGLRADARDEALYTESAPRLQPCWLTFVPYRYWGNRGENEMLVWFNVKHCAQAHEIKEEPK